MSSQEFTIQLREKFLNKYKISQDIVTFSREQDRKFQCNICLYITTFLKWQYHKIFFGITVYFLKRFDLGPIGTDKNGLVNFSLSRRYSNFKFEKFDSEQCQPARSLTPCSVSLRRVDSAQCQPARSLILRRVTYLAKTSAKTNLSAKPFQPVNKGPRGVRFHSKNANKSRDTATLKENNLCLQTNIRYISCTVLQIILE